MNTLTLGERIKKVRKSLDLTQQEFADRIGSKRNTIATYEMGRTAPSAAVISLVCAKFNISEDWLRNGTGEMHNPKTSAAMEALARERGLSHSDYILIEKFLNMKPESRLAVAEYMLQVAAALNSDDVPLDCTASKRDLDIDAEVDIYRSDLLAYKHLAAEQEAEAEAFGERAKILAKEQYLSEKKQESETSFAKESDAG